MEITEKSSEAVTCTYTMANAEKTECDFTNEPDLKNLKPEDPDDHLNHSMDTYHIKKTNNQVSCGWGPLKLPCFRRFASVQTFITLYFAYAFFNGFQNSYTVAVLTTLERRFNLPSSLSGMLVTTSTVGFAATTLFVSHFGRRLPIARVFSACILLNAMCAFLYVIPHWLYGTGNEDIDDNVDVGSLVLPLSVRGTPSSVPIPGDHLEDGYDLPTQYCFLGRNDTEKDAVCDDSDNLQLKSKFITFNMVAFGLFATSEVLQGFAGTPIWSLGIEFLDNSTSKDVASKLIGIMYSVRFISPTLSFVLGAWFLSIYGNLQDTSLTPLHPRWIGAWWVGFLVSAVATLVIFVPMTMLPNRMRPIVRTKGSIKDEPPGEKTKLEGNVKEADVSTRGSFREMLKSMGRLMKNAVYSLTMIGIIIDVLMVGYVIFVPKYLEVQFQMTSTMANVFGGMIPALCGGVSSLVSGYISAKIETKIISPLCRFTFIFSALTILSALPMTAIGCHQLQLAGSIETNKLEVSLPCNANCSCTKAIFDPMCGTDGLLYYSPCHAGCKENIAMETNSSLSECGCIPDGQGERGMCPTDCLWSLVPYLISFYITVFVANLYNVPATNTLLRCVDKEDKSMAMGFLTFFMAFLVFPAPILYGRAIDSTCLTHIAKRGTACDDFQNSSGACLLYNRAEFRYKFHAIFVALKILSTIVYIVPWVLIRKKEKRQQFNEEWELGPLQVSPFTQEEH